MKDEAGCPVNAVLTRRFRSIGQDHQGGPDVTDRTHHPVSIEKVMESSRDFRKVFDGESARKVPVWPKDPMIRTDGDPLRRSAFNISTHSDMGRRGD
jgi:hypothetical protein